MAAPMTQRTRALIYVRKSMVRQKRDEISPERQLASCQASAAAHGWRVDGTDIYQDAEGHRSGRSEEHRPAWQTLKERVRSDPSVAAVVMNSLDRGSRSPKDFFNFLDLIQRHGVEVVSVTEQFDTSTAIGRAFLAILMVVASLESDLASERTTATIGYLKGQGKHWGQTPYGYTRDADQILQPDENAPVVVEAMEFYARGGRSFGDVAQHLNAHPNGYRWRACERDAEGKVVHVPVPFTRDATRSILSNVLIYAGYVPVGRGKDMNIIDKALTLRELAILTDAVPGLHRPLIDEDLADQVLVARRRRKALAVRRDERVYLLTPILRCATCGRPLRGKIGRRGNTGPRYCHRNDTDACVQSSHLDLAATDGTHDAEALEQQALRLLDMRLPETVLSRLRGAVAERIRTRPENTAIQAEITELQARKNRLRDLYLLGDYAQEEYTRLRAALQYQIEEAERRLGGADYPVETVLARVDRLGDLLSTGSRDQQKRAFSLLFDHLTVDALGDIKEADPQPWARPLFVDLVKLSGDHECPQGNSNPCRRLERAVS